MRTIKFRAWHTELKKMFTAKEMAEDQLTLLPTGYFINVHSVPKLSDVDYGRKMLPLQFTGLHDKNGEEIYEGDVIKCIFGNGFIEDFSSGSVFFESSSASFMIQCPRGVHRFSEIYSIEIIGNIYENA